MRTIGLRAYFARDGFNQHKQNMPSKGRDSFQAITASSGPVNVKSLIKSLIFGKIKRSHGSGSGLNAGWISRFTFSEVKNVIMLFAVCGDALSWCNKMRILRRFSLTFFKILGKEMVV
ncbi:hypothetical protein EVAR_95872_1 [Eumeta japonica]|uniref:Uncharacterized protein n=1 Tax=Eumeta variegata TaxID=151549 RepID=A0A4C1VLL9_EUMVA|nr:hypothetical protein EVAR_95872_1 [Eumeta japonica]